MSSKHIFLRDAVKPPLSALLTSLLLLIGCLGEEGGVVVENPALSNDRLLVGIVFISPESEVQVAQISEARSLLDVSTNYRPIDRAIVRLSRVEDASEVSELFRFDQEKAFYTSNAPVLEGEEYAISVDYLDKSLLGRTKVPKQLSQFDITQFYISEIEEDGRSEWNVKLNIHDDPEEENSYHLSFSAVLSAPLRLVQEYPGLYSPEDIGLDPEFPPSSLDTIITARLFLTDWNGIEMLIKDQGREGQVLREDISLTETFVLNAIKEGLEQHNEVQAELEVTIITSDYNYYRYYKAIRNEFVINPQPENGGDGFVPEDEIQDDVGPFGGEPTLFPKDLEGGVGIFAAYRVSTYRFDLRELFQGK